MARAALMVRRDCSGFDNFDTVHHPPVLMNQDVAVHDINAWIIDETATHLKINANFLSKCHGREPVGIY
jgi:hypothetical protein